MPKADNFCASCDLSCATCKVGADATKCLTCTDLTKNFDGDLILGGSCVTTCSGN